MYTILNIKWSAYATKGAFSVQVEDSDNIFFHGQFDTYEEAMKAAYAAFKDAIELAKQTVPS